VLHFDRAINRRIDSQPMTLQTGPWGRRPFNIEWNRVQEAQMPTWAGPPRLRAATNWSTAEPAFLRNQPVIFPRFGA
jgi:hypothetical protein